MIIGIDIDSTITSTGKRARECLAEYDPKYDNHHKLPKDKYEEFLNLYEGYIHETCELKPGVKEAFRYFNDNNYKIVIITARDNLHCDNQEEITIDYFKRYNLKYDKIIFGKHDKGSCAYENDVSIFIDDKEENLDDINKFGIECIRFSKETDSKYKTFDNWGDIIEYIKLRKE